MTCDNKEDARIKSFARNGWTTEGLIDDVFLDLAKNPRYPKRAQYLLYRIPIDNPTPVFVVHISDLRHDLKHELDRLDDFTLSRVMREAIGRLFENENLDYFLLSVKRLLRWRFEA